MNAGNAFFDSNVLIYLMASGEKPARARELLIGGGTVSVQVLNEIAAVAHRKIRLEWDAIREVLAAVRFACTVHPLSLSTHDRGLTIAQRLRFSVYDSMIVSSALEAGCTTLFSEDLQHGQRVEDLTIRNPFLNL